MKEERTADDTDGRREMIDMNSFTQAKENSSQGRR